MKDNVAMHPYPKMEFPNCDMWTFLKKTMEKVPHSTALVSMNFFIRFQRFVTWEGGMKMKY